MGGRHGAVDAPIGDDHSGRESYRALEKDGFLVDPALPPVLGGEVAYRGERGDQVPYRHGGRQGGNDYPREGIPNRLGYRHSGRPPWGCRGRAGRGRGGVLE